MRNLTDTPKLIESYELERLYTFQRNDLVFEHMHEILACLEAGIIPHLDVDVLTCLKDDTHDQGVTITDEHIATLSASLKLEDMSVCMRALEAMSAHERAWLGFKIVYDSEACMTPHPNDITVQYNESACADDQPMMFVVTQSDIIASRAYSDRDAFQMKDVTRGPSMHTHQFPGVIWVAMPLFTPETVWLLGAGEISRELSTLLAHVGFRVVVVDVDTRFLTPERFAEAQLVHAPDFKDLPQGICAAHDAICVLTRGHEHDVDACMWALHEQVAYTGILGCAKKNDTVRTLLTKRGVPDELWQRIKRPIGIDCGAKTPAELAVAITAELIQVRYNLVTSAEARARHARNIGIQS